MGNGHTILVWWGSRNEHADVTESTGGAVYGRHRVTSLNTAIVSKRQQTRARTTLETARGRFVTQLDNVGYDWWTKELCERLGFKNGFCGVLGKVW